MLRKRGPKRSGKRTGERKTTKAIERARLRRAHQLGPMGPEELARETEKVFKGDLAKLASGLGFEPRGQETFETLVTDLFRTPRVRRQIIALIMVEERLF